MTINVIITIITIVTIITIITIIIINNIHVRIMSTTTMIITFLLIIIMITIMVGAIGCTSGPKPLSRSLLGLGFAAFLFCSFSRS